MRLVKDHRQVPVEYGAVMPIEGLIRNAQLRTDMKQDKMMSPPRGFLVNPQLPSVRRLLRNGIE